MGSAGDAVSVDLGYKCRMGAAHSRDVGIVVGGVDYGEADRIVTLLTRDHGKLKGMARSAKKSRRRFGASLELCAKVEVLFRERPGAELVHLESCELLDGYLALRGELTSLAAASYAAELCREVAQEREASPRLFALLDRFLGAVARGDRAFGDTHGLVRAFELRALDLLGWRPELARCAVCGSDLEAVRRVLFCAAQGGALCASCGEGARGHWLSPETCASLRAVLAGQRVTLTEAVLHESEAALGEFLERHLDRPLRSRAFLHLGG